MLLAAAVAPRVATAQLPPGRGVPTPLAPTSPRATPVTPATTPAVPPPPPPPPGAALPPTTLDTAPRGPSENALLAQWLRASTEVSAWRGQIGAARFDVVTSTLWPNPQVQLNTLITPLGTPPDGRQNYGVQLTLPLPIFGQIAARHDAALAALRVAEVNVLATLWARATDIQLAAVNRAFAEARVALAQRNLAEVARVETIVQRRVAAGANSTYDALRVATAIATLRAALADAMAERDRAEASLLALLAVADLRAAPITREGLAAFRGPESADALVRLALRRRPDLELARRGIAAAEASAARYRREVVPVPSVSLGLYATQGEASLSVTGAISLPLPAFDRNQGLIGHALADAASSRALASALGVRITNEVVGAFRARARARVALEEFRASGLRAAAELLQRAEVTYTAGAAGGNTFTIIDLLDAYRAMWDARAQELALERTFADAEADLERAAALVTP